MIHAIISRKSHSPWIRAGWHHEPSRVAPVLVKSPKSPGTFQYQYFLGKFEKPTARSAVAGCAGELQTNLRDYKHALRVSRPAT
ncbi:hypothetical protein PSACC_01528 [Paramicrosporidium saccamoebae]|uniref:Uncharacterized protein n=1 Tax=Paramicrosporidium saccamoebae TaxID=1246581 RepID=A0A2H9TLL4_9FUNG|nr:hypothetical protein PSACC_01528 [Paramicrosporidium saccamoebae]